MCILVVGKERERLHELVTFGHGQIGIVQIFAALTVDIKPPITLQYRLIEQSALRTQERLHDETVVGEGAHMEYLAGEKKHLGVSKKYKTPKCRQYIC